MQSLDSFGQDFVGSFLAQEHEELPDGVVDQAAPFRFGLAGFTSGRSFAPAEPKLSDGGFNDSRGDSAAASLLNGLLPGELRLLRGESDQGPDLALVFRLLLTICQQSRKDLGRRDKAVDVVGAVFPLEPAILLERVVSSGPIELPVADAGQGQAHLDEGVPAAGDYLFTGVIVGLHRLGEQLGFPQHRADGQFVAAFVPVDGWSLGWACRDRRVVAWGRGGGVWFRFWFWVSCSCFCAGFRHSFALPSVQLRCSFARQRRSTEGGAKRERSRRQWNGYARKLPPSWDKGAEKDYGKSAPLSLSQGLWGA